jgi:FkbM family methyltransferase
MKKFTSKRRKMSKRSFPLACNDITINGNILTMVTPKQDTVLGAWIRGEKEFCKYSLAELDFLEGIIKPGHNVLDAGANFGLYSIFLAKLQPTASIYSFEPDPFNYSLLNLNLFINRITNVKTFNFAIGKKEDVIEFYLNETNFGDHRSAEPKETYSNQESWKTLPMKVMKVNPIMILEKVLGEAAPIAFDLLKIDTQGADFEILEAFMPYIRPRTCVTIEYSPYHLYLNGTLKETVYSIVKNFSYIQRINPIGESPRSVEHSIDQILRYYDEGYKNYKGYYDLVLTY